MRTSILSGALLLAATALVRSDTVQVGEVIRRQLETAGQPAELRIEDELIHASLALPAFYERRAFAPAWSRQGRFESRARELLDSVREVHSEGLRPTDYHLGSLEARLAAGAAAPERMAETDLLLTDAFLILASHLVSGRVDPATFDPEWIAVRREIDVVERLEGVVRGEAIARTLRDLRPRHDGYGRLREALARYRRIEAEGGWPRLGTGPKLERGTDSPEVAVLRIRLAKTGDLAAPADSPVLHFDDVLASAVARFQRRHGLDDDGVVGPKTREALDVGVAQRAGQIEMNLERWRWLPQDLGARHLLVNVPEFRLRVAENDEQVLTMRVIVGRVVRRTPVFSDVMRYLVFSPSWEVPPTILRQDKLPAIRRDPGYAAAQKMQVFRLDGGAWVEVDPTVVDWSSVSPGKVRLRQRPGPTNALGLVKFMFPNAFNVYLHDTPSRELFAQSERDFSSGCIRVERPADLAAYLLREDASWTPEAIRAAMESGQERTVYLPRAIPVHIQYWTAWAASGGTVEFRRDLYERDRKLDAALRLPPPVEPEP